MCLTSLCSSVADLMLKLSFVWLPVTNGKDVWVRHAHFVLARVLRIELYSVVLRRLQKIPFFRSQPRSCFTTSSLRAVFISGANLSSLRPLCPARVATTLSRCCFITGSGKSESITCKQHCEMRPDVPVCPAMWDIGIATFPPNPVWPRNALGSSLRSFSSRPVERPL